MSESDEVKNHAEEFVQHDKYGQEQGSQQEQAEQDQGSNYSQDQGGQDGGDQQQG